MYFENICYQYLLKCFLRRTNSVTTFCFTAEILKCVFALKISIAYAILETENRSQGGFIEFPLSHTWM